MVKLFALAFLAVLGLASARVSKCPEVDGEFAAIMRNPEDCGSFYLCSNGVPVLMSCPAGLEFNAKLSVCDWPVSARCKVVVSPTSTTTRRPKTTTFRPRPKSGEDSNEESDESN